MMVPEANALRSKRLVSSALCVLGLIFALRCYHTYRVFNATFDEGWHLSSGLKIWQTGRYKYEDHHPPLGRALLALPPYLAGLRLPPSQSLWTGSEPEFYWRTLSLARAANLLFVPVLLVYVYLWGSRLFGAKAGLIAATVVSFSPNVLAHASVATLDFGGTVTTLACAYHFLRWSLEPALRNCLWAALTFGLALLIKFSALLFVPPLAVLLFLVARWSRLSWRPSASWIQAARRGLLFGAVVFLVIWAGYRFEFGPLPSGMLFYKPPARSMVAAAQPAVKQAVARRNLPAPAFARGMFDLVTHNAQGHDAYLLGRVKSSGGWWYYFPVALAVKTTLPLLLLMAMAVIAWLVGRQIVQPMLYPLLGAAVVMFISMSSNMNIGVRHILPIYPFLALAAAGLFAAPALRWPSARPAMVRLAAALAVWHCGESVLARPDYLAYFNQLARGREEHYLLDSNLDWGQDLARLQVYLAENQIDSVYLSYFGKTDPALLGMTGVKPLPAGVRPSGWIAVSKTHLAGLYVPKGSEVAWLKSYTPAARIGKSILLYNIPEGSTAAAR